MKVSALLVFEMQLRSFEIFIPRFSRPESAFSRIIGACSPTPAVKITASTFPSSAKNAPMYFLIRKDSISIQSRDFSSPFSQAFSTSRLSVYFSVIPRQPDFLFKALSISSTLIPVFLMM